MKKIIISKHIVFATVPRLSDEDPDPMERDDSREANYAATQPDGWLPWTVEDIEDIRRIVNEHLDPKEQFIIEAFLDGLNYTDISVTEKYWRYHFAKSIEIIKRELGL